MLLMINLEIFIKIQAEQDALKAGGDDLDANLMDAFRAHQKVIHAHHTSH